MVELCFFLLQIDEETGYFRADGFGMLSIYKSDLDSIGGFNLAIAGWGMEDIDLFTKVKDIEI